MKLLRDENVVRLQHPCSRRSGFWTSGRKMLLRNPNKQGFCVLQRDAVVARDTPGQPDTAQKSAPSVAGLALSATARAGRPTLLSPLEIRPDVFPKLIDNPPIPPPHLASLRRKLRAMR